MVFALLHVLAVGLRHCVCFTAPVAALTASFSEAMAALDEEFPDGDHQVPTGAAEKDDLLADDDKDPDRRLIDESWEDSNVDADAVKLAATAAEAPAGDQVPL